VVTTVTVRDDYRLKKGTAATQATLAVAR